METLLITKITLPPHLHSSPVTQGRPFVQCSCPCITHPDDEALVEGGSKFAAGRVSELRCGLSDHHEGADPEGERQRAGGEDTQKAPAELSVLELVQCEKVTSMLMRVAGVFLTLHLWTLTHRLYGEGEETDWKYEQFHFQLKKTPSQLRQAPSVLITVVLLHPSSPLSATFSPALFPPSSVLHYDFSSRPPSSHASVPLLLSSSPHIHPSFLSLH
ncbi:unnamed protein product [Pleuronectes platessa]|uniref:Uncharacterized protein n=1 Tax=Pleuronectes platessa TaxID=8262 RepID=A0A9N7UTB6_PLEPL|nr:unnamed protein product [Pleuronectes platessa]